MSKFHEITPHGRCSCDAEDEECDRLDDLDNGFFHELHDVFIKCQRPIEWDYCRDNIDYLSCNRTACWWVPALGIRVCDDCLLTALETVCVQFVSDDELAISSDPISVIPLMFWTNRD